MIDPQDKLIKALMHYADRRNWDSIDGSCSRYFQNWEGKTYRALDFGDTAREALKGIIREENRD